MANTSKKTSSSWSYKDFKQSDEATAAEQRVKELESNAPGAFTYDTYEKSDIAKQADAAVEQHKANKPGKMEYSKQAGLDDIWNQIMNREDFSYDLNGDALYQQYKDQYVLQGQQAMMDTMGQAAAMTGGYGNSYAQTAGQQTYQGYLQQLNDKVPELYQLALDKYNQEGQDLYNKYSMHSDMYDKEYEAHRDSVSDYYTELQYLTDNARYMSEDEYNKYWNDLQMKYGIHRDNVSDYYTNLGLATDEYRWLYDRDYGQHSDDRSLSYGQYRDQVADDQWKQTFEYQQGRDQVADDQWQKTFDEGVRQYNQNYALSAGKSSGGGGSSSGGGGDGSTSRYTAKPSGWDTPKVKAFQEEHDLAVDGVWGPKTAAAYDKDRNWVYEPDGGGEILTYQQKFDQNRFSNPDNLFSDNELKNFRRTLAQNRGVEGRCQLIDDALNEGKISGDTASALLEQYGISDEEFKQLRGYQ